MHVLYKFATSESACHVCATSITAEGPRLAYHLVRDSKNVVVENHHLCEFCMWELKVRHESEHKKPYCILCTRAVAYIVGDIQKAIRPVENLDRPTLRHAYHIAQARAALEIEGESEMIRHQTIRNVHYTAVTTAQVEAEYCAARPRSGPPDFHLRSWFLDQIHRSQYRASYARLSNIKQSTGWSPSPHTTNTFDLAADAKTRDIIVLKAKHEELGTLYFCVLPEHTMAALGEAFIKVRYQIPRVQVKEYRSIFTFKKQEILWDTTVGRVR